MGKIGQALARIGVDKYMHYIACLLIALFTFAICNMCGLGAYSAIPALTLPMIIGVGKEIHDKRTTGVFENADIAADFFGVFTAAVLIALLLI